MSEDTRQTANNTRQGAFSRFLTWVIGLPSMLLISLIISIVIELVGVGFSLWDEPGYLHALAMLRAEASYLSESFAHTKYGEFFLTSSVLVIDNVNGLLGGSLSFDPQGMPPESLSWHTNMLYAAAYIVKVFLLRLTVIVFNTPLFMFTVVVAATYGFVRRDLRRFGAGTEHVRRFLLFKKMIYPTMFLAFGIYLASPVTMHPIIIMLPAAFVLWVAIENAIAYYQKDF